MGCALGSVGQSLARIKKIHGAAPHKGRDIVSRKNSIRVYNTVHLLESITFSFVDQSTPNFLGLTWERL